MMLKFIECSKLMFFVNMNNSKSDFNLSKNDYF